LQIAILPQFLAIEHDRTEPHFVRKGCDGNPQITILLQFLAIEPHFVRKGSPDNLQIAILLQLLAIEHDRTEPHFVRKGCARTTSEKSQFYCSFWRSNLISCQRVASGQLANRNFTSTFGDRTSFRAKGLRPEVRDRNFTAVFGDQTSFRAKGLRFVPSHWHCPAPSREK